MSKSELIKSVAEKTNASQIQVKEIVDLFLDVVKKETLESGRFAIGGFGIFKKYVSAERVGRNPQTGASVNIPSKTSIKFKESA